MVGGGTGGSAVAAKMTSVLGKENVMILDAADVPKYRFFHTLFKFVLTSLVTHLTETLLSANVHNDWWWHEETQ